MPHVRYHTCDDHYHTTQRLLATFTMAVCNHWTGLVDWTVIKPAVQNMYKPCRSRKCIQGHIPMHKIFAVFFFYFFIPVLSRPSFTARTPKTRRKSKSSTFLSFTPHSLETSMSSAVNVLCMPSASFKKSASRKKWHVLVTLD